MAVSDGVAVVQTCVAPLGDVNVPVYEVTALPVTGVPGIIANVNTPGVVTVLPSAAPVGVAAAATTGSTDVNPVEPVPATLL